VSWRVRGLVSLPAHAGLLGWLRDVGDNPVNSDDVAQAEAYSYIPLTVLGDMVTQPEPNWLEMTQITAEELFVGVRQRNWTSKHFR